MDAVQYAHMRTGLLIALGIIIGSTLSTFIAMAWTAPTANPPGANVSSPVNVGNVMQIKNGTLGVNDLGVFGDTILSGSGTDGTPPAYLNFGATAGTNGYGIRNNAGILEFKNSGDSQWYTLQSLIFNFMGGGTTWAVSSNGTDIHNADSGNVGINTTSPLQTLEVGGNIKAYGGELFGIGGYLGFNAYYNGGWKYRTSDYAYYLRHDGADLGIWVAGSGTAGNTFTATQALAVTAGGNVGIGTTTPNSALTVSGGISSMQNGPVWSSYSTQYLPNVINTNNLPASSFFGGFTSGGYVSGGQATTFTAAIDTPAADGALLQPGNVAGNVNVAAQGVALSASTVKGSVGVFGGGMSNADGTSQWGIHSIATNWGALTGTGLGYNNTLTVAAEYNVRMDNPASGPLTGKGVGNLIYGSFQSIPTGGAYGIEIGSPGPGLGWSTAIAIDDAPNPSAISIGATGSATDASSQSILFKGRAGGIDQFTSVLGDQYGDLAFHSNVGHVFYVGANQKLVIKSNGHVGIGTSNPDNPLSVVVSGETAENENDISFTDYTNSPISIGFVGARARGTVSAPAAVKAGDYIATFVGHPYNGSAFSTLGGGMKFWGLAGFSHDGGRAGVGKTTFCLATRPINGFLRRRAIFRTKGA